MDLATLEAGIVADRTRRQATITYHARQDVTYTLGDPIVADHHILEPSPDDDPADACDVVLRALGIVR